MTETIEGCECSPGVRFCGDGCRYCQPQAYINELEGEAEGDLENIENLEKDWDYLTDSLEMLIETIKAEEDVDTYKGQIELAEKTLKELLRK